MQCNEMLAPMPCTQALEAASPSPLLTPIRPRLNTHCLGEGTRERRHRLIPRLDANLLDRMASAQQLAGMAHAQCQKHLAG